jgi:methylmalonyl-CoA/ethylmalonyl-CoA epimerase
VLKRIDHVGVVVDNLDEARRFLAGIGLRHDRDLDVPGRLKASFYTCGEIEIEVLEIIEPAERSRRLGEAPARIEHIAIEVDSLANALSRLATLGVRMQTDAPVRLDKGLNYWTVAETCDGVIYQLIEASGGRRDERAG